MVQLFVVPVLAVAVILLIAAELRGRWKLVYVLKPAATLLVIVVAALSWRTPAVDGRYSTWVLVGLSFSLLGDIALMFDGRKAFLAGLVALLLAHIVCAVLFGAYNGFCLADLVTASLLLIAAVAAYRCLLPGLGRIKAPVLSHVMIISFMVNRALSTLFGDAFGPAQARLIAAGAVLFCISDLMLGISRFRRPFRLHHTSLAFYYAGQAMIALSASYFA
jgi:uncharacterized membrane protein YhhN